MAGEAVDFSDFTQAAAGLRRFDELSGAAAEEAIDDAAIVVRDAVRRRRARHRKTGKGEQMVKVYASGQGDGHRARVHAGGRVAHLITGGTQPHRIRARGHALTIGGVGRGFAASVRHPGTDADPFVAEGVRDARGRIDDITDDAADELVAGLARELEG